MKFAAARLTARGRNNFCEWHNAKRSIGRRLWAANVVAIAPFAS
jgi:hypothetical protein